eukprot:1723050-Pyramimonas_sp.AAC.1
MFPTNRPSAGALFGGQAKSHLAPEASCTIGFELRPKTIIYLISRAIGWKPLVVARKLGLVKASTRRRRSIFSGFHQ